MKLCSQKHFTTFAIAALFALPVFGQTVSPLGKLPLFFEANQGQAAASVAFIARTADGRCAISGGGIALDFNSPSASHLEMNFLGANASAKTAGENELAGKINYLVGNDSSRWQSGVPTFAKVRVQEIYPGVDVVYYGNQHELEYDFNFAPGADPSHVAMNFSGAKKIEVNAQGQLVIALDQGELRQPQPEIYQSVNGQRKKISGGYKLMDAQTVAFNVGSYDHSLPLVIDPVLSYSTYLGGSSGDTAWAVALNPTDNSIYVAGQTFSTRFTNNIAWSTVGAYQTNFNGGVQTGDAFIARIDSTGTNLIYLTYLGGSSDDVAYGLAVDAQGDAYICGFTFSTNFPTTNAIPGGTNIHGIYNKTVKLFPSDVIVAELNPAGSGLIYSTYLGAESFEVAYGIALDSLGDAFVTGFTYSTNFPVTTNTAFQPRIGVTNTQFTFHFNAFVTEIAAGGSTVNYSTYLGGTNADSGRAIAFNNNEVFVAGYSLSTNFPAVNYINQTNISSFTLSTNVITRTNVYDGHKLNNSTNDPASDTFVAAFTVAGTSLNLLYSTLLGGTNNDRANGITADAAGNAYLVGATSSRDFPETFSGNARLAYVRTNNALFVVATNAFVTQVQWNGTSAVIGFSDVFGGNGIDTANAVALGATGNIFVTGSASSTNFPVTAANLIGSLRATNSGGSDVFVTAFSPDASTLLYSTYLGGRQDDFGYGIAVDSADAAYVAGQTLSTNFPAFNARQKIRNGTNDAFLAKIIFSTSLPQLSAGVSGANMTVVWSPFAEAGTNALGVETSTNLLGTNWVLTAQPPVLNGSNYIYTFNPTNRMRFFRLRKF